MLRWLVVHGSDDTSSFLFQVVHVGRALSQIRQRSLCLAAGMLLLGRASVCQDYLHEVAGSLGSSASTTHTFLLNTSCACTTST